MKVNTGVPDKGPTTKVLPPIWIPRGRPWQDENYVRVQKDLSLALQRAEEREQEDERIRTEVEKEEEVSKSPLQKLFERVRRMRRIQKRIRF